MKKKSNKIPRHAYLCRIVETIHDEMRRRGQVSPAVWRELEEGAALHSRTMWAHLTLLLFGADLGHGKRDMQRRWLAMGEGVLMEQLWQTLVRYARVILDVRAPRRVTFHQDPPPPWMRG